MEGFTFKYRNPGHWDVISTQTGGRLFRIRGGPGEYWVADHRPVNPLPIHNVKTVSAATLYVTDILMFELIVADGQTPLLIESWNVGN